MVYLPGAGGCGGGAGKLFSGAQLPLNIAYISVSKIIPVSFLFMVIGFQSITNGNAYLFLGIY